MTAPSLPCAEWTLRNEQRDFVQWHRGRQHYALWAIHLESEALQRRVLAAQQHLAPWLLDGYRRQPHITLGVCGFLSAAPTLDDDFGAATLQAQLGTLRRLRPAPFGLAIGGLESFSSVPYLSVQADAANLQALRQCLATHAGINMPQERYTPHVTVGLYGGVWPLSELRAAFGRFQPGGDLPLHVDSIQLLSYAAHEIGGPLRTLADFDLASGNLRWHAAGDGLPAPFGGVV